MNLSIPLVMALASTTDQKPGLSDLFGGPTLFLIAMFGFMYFVMIRPQSKRQKELRALIAGLSKGDEVVTNGGIAGRVDEVGETFLSVEIAPGVLVKVQKGAVSQVLPKGSLKSV